MKEVIISIKPEYALAIIKGWKRIEFRKSKPDIEVGTRCYIYASAPYKMIIGYFIYWGCVIRQKDKLWEKVQSIAGITKEEYDAYYKKQDLAYGWIIMGYKKMEPFPIEVFDLKRPPQSYQYIYNIHY